MTLSTPAPRKHRHTRTVHAEGECNEDMLKLLSEYVVNSLGDDDLDDDLDDDFDDDDFDDDDEFFEEEQDEDFDDDQPSDKPIDPRWAALNNLSSKN